MQRAVLAECHVLFFISSNLKKSPPKHSFEANSCKNTLAECMFDCGLIVPKMEHGNSGCYWKSKKKIDYNTQNLCLCFVCFFDHELISDHQRLSNQAWYTGRSYVPEGSYLYQILQCTLLPSNHLWLARIFTPITPFKNTVSFLIYYINL